jgi:hypothetical protein
LYNGITNYDYLTGYTWTGLTDIGAEGTFVWECSGESPDYILNNFIYSNTELNDCVQLASFEENYWESGTCSTNKPYICEKALVSENLIIIQCCYIFLVLRDHCCQHY